MLRVRPQAGDKLVLASLQGATVWYRTLVLPSMTGLGMAAEVPNLGLGL